MLLSILRGTAIRLFGEPRERNNPGVKSSARTVLWKHSTVYLAIAIIRPPKEQLVDSVSTSHRTARETPLKR